MANANTLGTRPSAVAESRTLPRVYPPVRKNSLRRTLLRSDSGAVSTTCASTDRLRRTQLVPHSAKFERRLGWQAVQLQVHGSGMCRVAAGRPSARNCDDPSRRILIEILAIRIARNPLKKKESEPF